MKIITLVENTCGHEGCIAEHGLSLYIETENYKLLTVVKLTQLSRMRKYWALACLL